MYLQEPYKVYEGQCMLDVAVALYGDASFAFSLAYANDIGITTTLVAGQVIKVFDNVKNLNVLQVYKQLQIVPATAIGTSYNIAFAGGSGIGYMQIGTNFKVS
jgi:hypothetical protein